MKEERKNKEIIQNVGPASNVKIFISTNLVFLYCCVPVTSYALTTHIPLRV